MPTGKRPVEPDHGSLLTRTTVALFGRRVPARWVPSDEADVYVVEGPARLVVKIERPDLWIVRRERQVFPALRRMGFDEFPSVELTDEAWDDHDGFPFMVMPYTEHRPWREIWAEDPRQAEWVVDRIGTFLARLAVVDPGAVPGASTAGNIRPWFEEWYRPLSGGAMGAAVANVVDRCLANMSGKLDGFGGWQFAQVLTDGRRTFTAIDWGNIGAHWPMADLAGAIFALANFDDVAVDRLRPVLIGAYTGGTGLGDRLPEFDLWTATWWLLFAASAVRRGDAGNATTLCQNALSVVDSAPS